MSGRSVTQTLDAYVVLGHVKKLNGKYKITNEFRLGQKQLNLTAQDETDPF
jgi:hypothetical protein